MAEFVEVMRQAQRLMEAKDPNKNLDYIYFIFNCYDQPVYANSTLYASSPEVIEKYIMDWAAVNPEPKYPSFLEHFESIFPMCQKNEICVEFIYGEDQRPDSFKCDQGRCDECWNRTIPDELAVKLGVKKQKIIPLIGVVK